MQTHELKTDPEVFEEVFLGHKSFEIRKDDRGFQVGDILIARETKHTGIQMLASPERHPLIYTNRELARRVTYILRGPIYGLAEGWVIMSIQ